MKKIVSSIIIGSVVLAQGLYTPKDTAINLNKQIILKVSTKNNIQNININQNDFLINDNNKIKIFNISKKELIKTIPGEKLSKAIISTDGSKIIALGNKQLFILDKKTSNILTTIKGNFSNFVEKNNILILINNHYKTNQDIYNLTTGKKITSIKLATYIQDGAIAPNMKKFALNSNNVIFIYDMKGNLLNTISESSIKKIKWADKSHIIVDINHQVLKKFDVITSNMIASINPKGYYPIDTFNIIDINNVLIFNNNKLYLYNFNSNKPLKKYILSNNSNDNITSSIIKNNYLAIAYYTNSYLYKVNFFSKQPQIKQEISTKKITIPQTKIIVKEKIVEKKVYIKPKQNIKPTVEIYASQTSGVAPLKVNFKIIANDEDGKIVSYYINLAGQEAMSKGNPTKPFSYTFNKPGNYQIMVAVKDNKNAIATKKVIIKVREESFEDYKKNLLGN